MFIALTAGQDLFGGVWPYVLYALKTAWAAWAIWVLRPVIPEMRWALSPGAVVAGVAVFVMWVGLDDLLVRAGIPDSYPRLTTSGAFWNPIAYFGRGTVPGLALRRRAPGRRDAGGPGPGGGVLPVAGVSLPDSEELPPGRASGSSRGCRSWSTSLLFGSEHHEWLAGMLCGFAFQGLVCWKNRLGDAMTAHAITNFLLGVWVVWRGEWRFW